MNAADRIEIVKITPVTTGGALQAFVSVKIGALVIHDFRVVQQPGQEAWVSPPQREVTARDGTRKFYPVVEVETPLKKIVSEKVLASWHARATHEPEPVRAGTRPY